MPGLGVAYGSFLGDLHDEEGAQEQLEKAIELNSKEPAAYNNLANIYGHIGPVKKALSIMPRRSNSGRSNRLLP